MRAYASRQIFGFFFTSRQSRCTQAFGSWLAQDRARRHALLLQKRNEPRKSHCARRTRSQRRSRGSARHCSRVKPPGYFLCLGNTSSCDFSLPQREEGKANASRGAPRTPSPRGRGELFARRARFFTSPGGGRSPHESAAGGGEQPRDLKEAQRSPHPAPLRGATLPLQGRVKKFVLATRCASEVCGQPSKFAPSQIKPREAGRRKAQVHWSRATQRSVATRLCAGAAAGLSEPARLPALHRGTSPIARLISGPRFLELPGANGRTLPGASAASTLRAGHSAGRYDARSRPGAECVVPPAGTAPAPPSGAPSRKASLDDSTSRMVFRTIFSDACQAVVLSMGTGSRRGRKGGRQGARACTHKFGLVSGSMNGRFAPKAIDCCVATKCRDGPKADISTSRPPPR